ncbi:hypothetical protein M0804_003412 [Polistes exclamans]|nr:hypothetical protein M0804_003412 [Polistes exclamans]
MRVKLSQLSLEKRDKRSTLAKVGEAVPGGGGGGGGRGGGGDGMRALLNPFDLVSSKENDDASKNRLTLEQQ